MDLWARCVISVVWLYNGLWCKLLAGSPSHRDIIASAAEPMGLPTLPVLVAIGAGEVGLALWIVIGRQRHWAAWAQTVVLVGMNGAGLLWARGEIPDPGTMVIQNVVFLTLAWIVGLDLLRVHGRAG